MATLSTKNFDPGKIYRGTIGKPALQSAWQTFLWARWEEVERAGKLSNGYKRFLTACLIAAGADSDNDPAHDGDWGDKGKKV